jgi:hypothetical protein
VPSSGSTFDERLFTIINLEEVPSVGKEFKTNPLNLVERVFGGKG